VSSHALAVQTALNALAILEEERPEKADSLRRLTLTI
jgi:hypothetical protein